MAIFGSLECRLRCSKMSSVGKGVRKQERGWWRKCGCWRVGGKERKYGLWEDRFLCFSVSLSVLAFVPCESCLRLSTVCVVSCLVASTLPRYCPPRCVSRKDNRSKLRKSCILEAKWSARHVSILTSTSWSRNRVSSNERTATKNTCGVFLRKHDMSFRFTMIVNLLCRASI